MAEWLRPDVLLAATVVLGACPRPRIVEAQVVTAAADGLRFWGCRHGGSLLLSELTLGGKDAKPATVMALKGAASHGTDDKDQPPVAGHESGDAMHRAIVPHLSSQRQSGHQGRGGYSVLDRELAAADAADECIPFGTSEDQRRPVGIAGVA